MLVFFLRRAGQGALVLLATAALVFAGVHALGDPIDLLVSPEADEAERAAAAVRLGLDRPPHEQFAAFLAAAARGDLGTSFVHGTPALGLVLDRFPATLELAGAALVLAVAIGVPLGLWAGLRPEAASSRAIMAGSVLGFSLPTFWVGLLLIMAFAVWLGWLPSGGRGEVGSFLGLRSSLLTADGLAHLALPALNLALLKVALVIRLTRAGTREAAAGEHVRFARAKGLPTRRVVTAHVLRNALVPVVTVLGLEFGSLLAFSAVTEAVFAWPGMGKLLIDSILRLDRPVVVAYLLFTVLLFVLINLAVDLVCAALDPRVRLGRGHA